jgi:hypothetical protein
MGGGGVQDVLLLDHIHFAQHCFPFGRSLVVRSHCAEAHLARRESDELHLPRYQKFQALENVTLTSNHPDYQSICGAVPMILALKRCVTRCSSRAILGTSMDALEKTEFGSTENETGP